MPTTISSTVNEESSAVFTVAFTDEAGAAVTPNAVLTWTLTDAYGTVINSRDGVSLTPATSVTIKLSGDDLSLAGAGQVRHLTVEGTYSSGGDTLALKDVAVFVIEDLVAVT